MKHTPEEILEIQEGILTKIKLADKTLKSLYDALDNGNKTIRAIVDKIVEFTEYRAKLDEQMQLFNNTLKQQGDM